MEYSTDNDTHLERCSPFLLRIRKPTIIYHQDQAWSTPTAARPFVRLHRRARRPICIPHPSHSPTSGRWLVHPLLLREFLTSMKDHSHWLMPPSCDDPVCAPAARNRSQNAFPLKMPLEGCAEVVVEDLESSPATKGSDWAGRLCAMRHPPFALRPFVGSPPSLRFLVYPRCMLTHAPVPRLHALMI